MDSKSIFKILQLVAILAVIGVILNWCDRPRTRVVTIGIPEVTRTKGGLLEVATVNANEIFTRVETNSFWGIPLGKTTSEIRAQVVYKYHIKLDPDWTATIKGKTCIVKSPPIEPSLPVAIIMESLEKRTSGGWFQFKVQAKLDALERSMTLELAEKAKKPEYIKSVTADARETVKEFVTKWLIDNEQWKTDPEYNVIVEF